MKVLLIDSLFSQEIRRDMLKNFHFGISALSLILCKHQKVQKTKMYFREVVYRPLDCILAEDGAFVKGGAAVHLDP